MALGLGAPQDLLGLKAGMSSCPSQPSTEYLPCAGLPLALRGQGEEEARKALMDPPPQTSSPPLPPALLGLRAGTQGKGALTPLH